MRQIARDCDRPQETSSFRLPVGSTSSTAALSSRHVTCGPGLAQRGAMRLLAAWTGFDFSDDFRKRKL